MSRSHNTFLVKQTLTAVFLIQTGVPPALPGRQ